MKNLGILFVALSSLAIGCGKKGGGDAAAKPLDLAGVNALVPAPLKDKLVFEERKIEEERGRHTKVYTVAAPKAWVPGFKGFAQLKPDDKEADSFMTKLSVGTNCDGSCEPKDWGATVGKVYESYLKGKVIKDEKGKNSRTIIAEAGDQRVVLVATWTDGASEYSSCEATLDKPWFDAAPAFEKACQVVNVSEK
jgi:hypothetical protein